MTERHSWSASGRTKECSSCHLQAVGRVRDSAGHWTSVWQSRGVPFASTRTPVCGQPLPDPAPAAERARLADEADKAAHQAYVAGELERAAHLVETARVLDASRSDLWDQRDAGIRRAIEKAAPDEERAEVTGRAGCPAPGSGRDWR